LIKPAKIGRFPTLSYTVKALLSLGGLFFVASEGRLIERWVITEGGVLLTQRKTFYTNGLLHSLCIASIGKSVQAILAVNSY